MNILCIEYNICLSHTLYNEFLGDPVNKECGIKKLFRDEFAKLNLTEKCVGHFLNNYEKMEYTVDI